ncbi:Transferase [Sesbania bispinosa]|nr:Transferase [Sesbania bispinosa]
MGSLFLVFLILLVDDGLHARGSIDTELSFDQNYEVIWGDDHVVSLNQGKEIQLTMDNSSGSGFGSKMTYGSGLFHLRIKVPDRNSAGVVTAYYMAKGIESKEFTFGLTPQQIFTITEFFGTNIKLCKTHASSNILLFYVDNIPIRVYKNKSNIGVGYPSKPMQIQATLWDGDSWATNGVLVPIMQLSGAGIVVAAARTDKKLGEFGRISAPNPELRELVVFLYEEGEEEINLKEKPLASLQLTQFGCGSLALASHYNHCILDGIAVRDFEVNLAALTRGDDLIIVPNADRTLLRAQNPPKIKHPHFEYSKSTGIENLFTIRGTSGINARQSLEENQIHVLYLSPQKIGSFKKKALKNSNLKNSTTFQVIAAKIWKARSIATKMPEDTVSTMLFPVDVRKRIVPELPDGFAGNALVPGFARATVRELMELDDACHIRKVQEGIERLDDEYIKSGIDWLEVNRGVPCRDDSFSLVAWWRLGLEEQLFAWGKLKCATPLAVKPGLVMLLPGAQDEGGLSICLNLPEDQMQEFCRIMLEI